MIIAALCLLGASLLFVVIVLVALYFNVVRPMQIRQIEQDELIAKNAGATIGLYTAHQRRLNLLSDKVAFVEAYAVPTLPKVEAAPITVRSGQPGMAA